MFCYNDQWEELYHYGVKGMKWGKHVKAQTDIRTGVKGLQMRRAMSLKRGGTGTGGEYISPYKDNETSSDGRIYEARAKRSAEYGNYSDAKEAEKKAEQERTKVQQGKQNEIKTKQESARRSQTVTFKADQKIKNLSRDTQKKGKDFVNNFMTGMNVAGNKITTSFRDAGRDARNAANTIATGARNAAKTARNVANEAGRMAKDASKALGDTASYYYNKKDKKKYTKR